MGTVIKLKNQKRRNFTIRPKYEKLGVLSYQELEDNFNVDWAEISKPYETQEQIEQEISSVFENSAQN